jgi:hypothetical protein
MVRVFSSIKLFHLLVTAYLLEYFEDVTNANAHNKADKLGPIKAREPGWIAN